MKEEKSFTEVKEIDKIKALGFLFSTYREDLNYIENFYKFKENGKTQKEYHLKSDEFNKKYTFRDFLNAYRITRRINNDNENINDKVKILLSETKEWVDSKDSNNVDFFAHKLKEKNITRGIEISLSSKILFLNNPVNVFPIDTRVRKYFDLKDNVYSDYIEKVESYKRDYYKEIDVYLKNFEKCFEAIEINFTFINIQEIRINRFLDKLFWSP